MKKLLITILLFLTLPLISQEASREFIFEPLPGDSLSGELILLKESTFIALIIPGSGPNNRDGNSADGRGNDNLKKLALALKEKGISSLRMDKRGGGPYQSIKNPEEIRFQDFVEDAVMVGNYLKALTGKKLVLIGHSQGSLVAAMAAEKVGALKVISLCGAGEPVGELLKYQLSNKLDEEATAYFSQKIDSLSKGHEVSNKLFVLNALLNPKVQPFLISYLKEDPCTHYQNLTTEVFIAQGGRDIQVPIAQGEKLKACCPKAGYGIYPSMNHVLVDVEESISDNLKSYNDKTRSITPQLMEDVVAFILN